MSYPITKKYIPGLPKIPYRKGVDAYEGVVNHSTDDLNATDENIRNYEASHWNNAFVHYAVDWDSITLMANYRYTAWGAGPKANPRFIHIELCETRDPKKFKASYDRYVWLTAFLLKRRHLGVRDGVTLWSHAEVSQKLGGTNHQDPIAYLKSHGVSWKQHVANVKAEYNKYNVKPSDYTVKPGDSLWEIARANKTTVGKLKALNHLKSDTIQPMQKLRIK